MKRRHILQCVVLGLFVTMSASSAWGQNLQKNPSFEQLRDRPTQYGHLFEEHWGWVYAAPGKFTVGRIAHTGKYSYLIVNDRRAKTRYNSAKMNLPAGRYRMTAWVRGLTIVGTYGPALEVRCIDKQTRPLTSPATFGWTPVTYVVDNPKEVADGDFSIGLVGSGWLWIDDVSLEKVDPTVALTPEPVWGKEEAPIAPPQAVGEDNVSCRECGYRNSRQWTACYACGEKLPSLAVNGETVKMLCDFEAEGQLKFTGGTIRTEDPLAGKISLQIDKAFVVCAEPQDWSDYDLLKVDVWNPTAVPAPFGIEIMDELTNSYWTRVNFLTSVPPGRSTVTLPTDIYVGEKSRPGRPLLRNRVTRLTFTQSKGPLVVDNVRLERYDIRKATFGELKAYDFGLLNTSVFPGYQRVLAGTQYEVGRGHGWIGKIAPEVRAFDGMQPDSLYQDFVVAAGASFQVDVPNGKYHVAANIDSPGGYWGEVQYYRQRQVIANSKIVVDETMNLEDFRRRYFRNAHSEDVPGMDIYAKYAQKTFQVKHFDVDVTQGKIVLEFKGGGQWPIALTSLVIYPATKSDAGKTFMQWTAKEQKNQFDDYFKFAMPAGVGAKPPAEDYVVFTRGPALANINDGPRPEDALPANGITCTAARGEEQSITLCVQPSSDPGAIDLEVSEFVGPGGAKLDASSLRPGWFDYRLRRVNLDGSVTTIVPQYWHPAPAPACAGTRNLWIRVKTPANAVAGRYSGIVTIKPAKMKATKIPVILNVLPFAMDPITDIAVGPWGCNIGLPWDGADPVTKQWNWSMFEKVATILHDDGFTTLTGIPTIKVASAASGKVTLDFTLADREMQTLREAGFRHMVGNYGWSGNLGYNLYGLNYVPDEAAATKVGFADLETYLKAVYGQIEEHAKANNWLPVAYNLCDEPQGDHPRQAAINAALHAKVARDLKLKYTTFMGATSMKGNDPKDPHYALIAALPMCNLAVYDDASIELVHKLGNLFASYNYNNRWTVGRYMKAMVSHHGMVLRTLWHLNAAGGDPYYALDSREDDYCFYNVDETQSLVPSAMLLVQMVPGLNDYRYLSTLERLIKERGAHPRLAEARRVLEEQLNLRADKDVDEPANARSYDADRKAVIEAILMLEEKN